MLRHRWFLEEIPLLLEEGPHRLLRGEELRVTMMAIGMSSMTLTMVCRLQFRPLLLRRR